MKLELYMLACSIIAITLLWVHSHVNERYSGNVFYEKKAEIASYAAKQKDMELALSEYKHLKFRQEIAKNIPSLINEDPYVARNIASVISDREIKLPQTLLEEKLRAAKAFFTDGNFLSAITNLKEIYQADYKSVYGPEIVYLLMESYHQLEDYKTASDYIMDMLKLYPESHLSGYAMLRLGDYYYLENRLDEAKYVYQFTIENFSFDAQILQEAKQKIGGL